ncbi:MAG: hypothetical protein QOD99_1802 [Chthoniobacter sp.]|jgi:23S rRNA G2445 N2-methylase RlmL|nr:hypothetical protein [Chthoniobacter sp.]
MKEEGGNPTKELYQRLRRLSCAELWEKEVAAFDAATPEVRSQRVALVRAVGVVFAENGTAEEKTKVRAWLRQLLHDPAEKIRRYAMAALPKIGAGPGEEAELVALLRTAELAREKKFAGKALEKIGGRVTLETWQAAPGDFSPQTAQKVQASVARRERPSGIRMEGTLREWDGLRIHLRGRRGLEGWVRDEVREWIARRGPVRLAEVRSGLVAITAAAPFTLAELFTLRCFGTVGFVLGVVPELEEGKLVEALAAVIASPLSRRLLEAWTEGSIRYRLEFVGKGHRRGLVRRVADRAYALCPAILNDAQDAPWAVDIHQTEAGWSVELRPRLAPDPRFAYRRKDVPAASHPPLAACLARLAGSVEREMVWDPFCGSGLELIERGLLGGAPTLYGSDRSAEAIAIAEGNFAAAKVRGARAEFVCCDFGDFPTVKGLAPGTLSLIITNPPMGKRVPIDNLRGLIADLFAVAAKMLRPGGRLVFANPLRMETPLLKLQSRQVVDFGGFDCRVERYLKAGR